MWSCYDLYPSLIAIRPIDPEPGYAEFGVTGQNGTCMGFVAFLLDFCFSLVVSYKMWRTCLAENLLATHRLCSVELVGWYHATNDVYSFHYLPATF